MMGLNQLLYEEARWIVKLEVIFITVRILLSWVRPSGYNRTFARIEEMLWRVTEPILGPIRSRLPSGFGLDFSPIIAIFLLSLALEIFRAILNLF